MVGQLGKAQDVVDVLQGGLSVGGDCSEQVALRLGQLCRLQQLSAAEDDRRGQG